MHLWVSDRTLSGPLNRAFMVLNCGYLGYSRVQSFAEDVPNVAFVEVRDMKEVLWLKTSRTSGGIA